jgi:integrase/recombinase XerC
MAKVVKVPWFTQERRKMVSEDNIKKFDKYLKSNIIKNIEVKDTTYKSYKSNFMQFLIWLAVEHDNVGIYSEEFMENAVDIIEEYMLFCQETLLNHKKTINNKLAAISSFYIWSMKRGFVTHHPFDKKLDRMKKANEEHILNTYFLTEEQIMTIRRELSENDKYTLQDQILFEISFDSANRIGALENLPLSNLNLDNMVFENIREKEGYRVEVVFEDNAKDLIEEWLEMRKDDYDNLECDSLFIHHYEGKWIPWTRDIIHRRMRMYGEIIGISDFRAHCMRKTKLNLVYEETGDLSLAASLANHKSTETTREFYCKKQSKSDVRDKINKLKAKNKLKEQGLIVEEETKIEDIPSSNGQDRRF